MHSLCNLYLRRCSLTYILRRQHSKIAVLITYITGCPDPQGEVEASLMFLKDWPSLEHSSSSLISLVSHPYTFLSLDRHIHSLVRSANHQPCHHHRYFCPANLCRRSLSPRPYRNVEKVVMSATAKSWLAL